MRRYKIVAFACRALALCLTWAMQEVRNTCDYLVGQRLRLCQHRSLELFSGFLDELHQIEVEFHLRREKLNGVCHLLVYVNYHHLLYDVPPNALTGPDFEMLPNVLWDRGLMLARDPGLLYFH